MSYYYAAMAYAAAGQTPPTLSAPVYGPPLPPPPPFYLQCGMCGQPVLGAGWNSFEQRYGAPTPATGHKCPGPFPVDMGDEECIGPFFDPGAAIGYGQVCCICLRLCETEDPEVVKGVWIGGSTYIPYVMNDHQQEWHHT